MARVNFVVGSNDGIGTVPITSSTRFDGNRRKPGGGTAFVSTSRHDITVHATSGFLRCRSEKTG